MPDLLDRLRLGTETFETIMERLVTDVNAGVDPASTAFADVVPGAILHDLYGACALEFDRAYDRVNVELPQTVIPTTTMGEWLDQWASVVGLERKDEVAATGEVTYTAAADNANPIEVSANSQVSTVAPDDNTDEIVYVTSSAITIAPGQTGTVAVVAYLAGATGNVPANSVTLTQSELIGVESVTNAAAITGGADVEEDEALSRRLKAKLTGSQGAGNVDDYVEWCTSHPGVDFCVVQPNWNGAGSVRCICTDTNNDPISQTVIDSLQAVLDPPALGSGGGYGKAPVGATVTVATPAPKEIDVAATIVFAPGYSLDGAGGTRALREEIVESLGLYVNGLLPGEDVVRFKIVAAIVDIEGVVDASSVTPNNTAVAALEVAVLDDVTLA